MPSCSTPWSPPGAAHGVGTWLVEVAVAWARSAGCEWLHVDLENHLHGVYFNACGFTPTKPN
jgi:GNAT superfamily N-acetyltransferase